MILVAFRASAMDTLRGHDIRLLKHFGIKYICDLMVEMRKMKYVPSNRPG